MKIPENVSDFLFGRIFKSVNFFETLGRSSHSDPRKALNCRYDHIIGPSDTRSFLYADDLCIASQKSSFEEVEKALSDALADLVPYYALNHLRANPERPK